MSEMDWELLDRYLSGEASAQERERVEAWLAEDPEHWVQLSAMRDAIANAALTESAIEEAKVEIWGRLEREMGGGGEPGGGARHRRTARRARDFAPSSRRPWVTARQVAAALLLVVVGGSALAVLLFRWRPLAPEVVMRSATTTPGQRAVFRLPDGTRVVLGVASTLRYPDAFGSASREVSLEGEAYFEVVHDEERPFVVRAGDLVAKDLGTEFTVRAYPEDAGARVVVREGRVAIRAATGGGSERVVAQGQLGRLGAEREPTVEPADTAAWFAWTEGRLVLGGIPLREALPQLSRWFDLEFRLADSVLGDVPLSATLRTQPTPEVLNNLAASLGMKQRREGRTVTLYSESR
jgi:ferric-dicitrate binding protein FerR (iron transport regulator)